MIKPKHILWGAFLILFGILLVLRNFNIFHFHFNWLFLKHWWPLIIIAAGINSLLKTIRNEKITWFMPLFWIVFFLFVSGVFTKENSSHQTDSDNMSSKKTEGKQHIFREFDPVISNVELNIEGGGSVFTIEDTTSYLIDSYTETDQANYTLEETKEGNKEILKLSLNSKNFDLDEEYSNDEVEVKLNPKPIWNINLHFGAGKTNFDFSALKLSNLDISAGAADMDIKIGDKFDKTTVQVEIGAAGVDMQIPESSGCQIISESDLSSEEFNGFIKKTDHIFETSNFNTSSKKIFIKFNGGVSKIEVNRY